MSTGPAPLHLLPLQEPERPNDLGSTDPMSGRRQGEEYAELPCHLAKLRFRAAAAYLFEASELITAAETTILPVDDVFRTQAKVLASYATTLRSGLAIDDIYAHALVRRTDILDGHRMRAFIAAPVRGPERQTIAVLCAADTNARCWNTTDLTDMQQIVAQTESLHLSHF